MSNNGENEAERVEQITRTPSNVQQKIKDPKKVAAGKKLAEKNRQMREEHARYKAAQEAQAAQASETSTTENSDGNSEWFPKLSFTSVISLAGIGLTVFNLYNSSMRSKDKPQSNSVHLSPVRINYKSQCEPQHESRNEPISKVPKYGM